MFEFLLRKPKPSGVVMLPEGRYADPNRLGRSDTPGSTDFSEMLMRGELLREVAFDVHLRGGAVVRGNATPDAVAWECPCGARPDLLSAAATPVTGGVRVDCPCGRGYWCGPGPWLVAVNGVWQDGERMEASGTV